ncbi:MAG: HAMP domain-containing histidine kinase [Lachnospiraceae bacterium]|nr:HAMP domain-containing histidine kinase [Lachnospiraceae bacterium]
MKQLNRLAFVFTLVMLAALYMFIGINKRNSFIKRDIVSYNDMLYMICEDYSAGMSEDDIEDKYGCVLVLSKRLDAPELSELYSSNAFVLDFAPEGEYLGKVAWTDVEDDYIKQKNDFFRAAMILWGAVLICGYLLLVILYLSVVRPVHEMESFSGEVAKGNLDIELPMRRSNLFGNFTEAFDLMREELKASKKREMEAEIARKEMITALSHDIKTPVAVIKAACEVLEVKNRRRLETIKGKPGRKDEESEIEDTLVKVGAISQKADTISALMSNVMHVTLEELDRIEVNAEPCNTEVIEEYFKSLTTYGRIITMNDIPRCLVYMDKLRMEQVIDNIVGNSYKYAGTDVRVSFGETRDISLPDGNSVRFIRITIRDQGPGVPEEDLPLIAGKYFRGKNTEGRTGYGLGLYLAKWYMEKQGGGLEYYNDNGFVVDLLVRKV